MSSAPLIDLHVPWPADPAHIDRAARRKGHLQLDGLGGVPLCQRQGRGPSSQGGRQRHKSATGAQTTIHGVLFLHTSSLVKFNRRKVISALSPILRRHPGPTE